MKKKKKEKTIKVLWDVVNASNVNGTASRPPPPHSVWQVHHGLIIEGLRDNSDSWLSMDRGSRCHIELRPKGNVGL